eukprot:CAMPEP_0194216154 /NCGR_PEP_ID=MMETSP0156-20130528/18425_1 /TAXON_ID=33649 /ORGANISM="Thalassionema nitzschioides, Strain L26-B" /LENGTH=361 /DNA_ID=CAMNT_0038944853 /DNA_START=54 /DNA_END=1140 /DNA_ORIENTATION=-
MNGIGKRLKDSLSNILNLNGHGNFNRKVFLAFLVHCIILIVSMQQRGPKLIFSKHHLPNYDWSCSTENNFEAALEDILRNRFHGKYTAIRKTLDYNYHSNYTRSRQLVQDIIIDDILRRPFIRDPKTGYTCATTSLKPWVVFTAGPMGAGKSWTIRHLASRGDFPLEAFVKIDQDDIRRHLPEFETYIRLNPKTAGDLTRKEAGLLAEILTLVAIEKGYNVLQDGSLRNAEWYQNYFQELRKKYPDGLKLGILHVTATPEVVYERAARRAKKTGRVVPAETLELSIQQVPRSVSVLRPLADFYAHIDNAPGALSLVDVNGSSSNKFGFSHASMTMVQYLKTISIARGDLKTEVGDGRISES